MSGSSESLAEFFQYHRWLFNQCLTGDSNLNLVPDIQFLAKAAGMLIHFSLTFDFLV